MSMQTQENVYYLKTIFGNTLELYKLRGIEAFTELITKLIFIAILSLVIFMIILFSTILLIYVIGNNTGNWIQALLIGGGAHISLFILIGIFRNSMIIKPLNNYLIKEYLE